MIILRNSYYSSPYYGGGYSDLEEKLYANLATAALKPINTGLRKSRELLKTGFNGSTIDKAVNVQGKRGGLTSVLSNEGMTPAQAKQKYMKMSGRVY